MKKLLIGLSVSLLSFSAMATSVETYKLISTVRTSSCEEILNVLLDKNAETARLVTVGLSAAAEEKYEQGKALKALFVEKCIAAQN